ncbi:hypothetical protein GCM10023085_05930 [Actinomadura viridis]|uniref:ATP-binding protein n=1 Tax=Actinomadura viridis TaxID=58110 RepID=A0A931GQD4_9ACTN|nr:ATP-binding protein [Actinomadura viridis]MBG6091611.1 hypothetical protein [Actinomadura viridis]
MPVADLPAVPHVMGRPVQGRCAPALCPPPLGRAWVLPPGPECVRYARTVLAEALTSAGAPRSAVCDATLMVSELATNAHQHAPDHGPHELWLYACAAPGEGPGGPSGEGLGQARCAVFDRHASARLPGYSWTSGDYGRGLSIVRELSEGQWGMLRTLSRCAPRAQGKAVWFAVPAAVRLPADLVDPPYGTLVPAPMPPASSGRPAS